MIWSSKKFSSAPVFFRRSCGLGAVSSRPHPQHPLPSLSLPLDSRSPVDPQQRWLYMIMERADRDLLTVIMDADRDDRDGRSGGRVDEALARDVMHQVISGLRYIHGMHVCHRDLKPENIVLVEKPGTPKPVVKIIDFGLCATTAGGPALLDLCGTPGFIPPEMITEDAYDGFLGDVWSVGAIALEMVLGHALFSEAWLPAYAPSLVASRKAFAMNMADALPRMRSTFAKRVKRRLASAASLDAVCAALMVNPRKRIVMDDFFTHRWIGGDLSGESGHVRGEESPAGRAAPIDTSEAKAKAAAAGLGVAEPGSPTIADARKWPGATRFCTAETKREETG